jgi:DNA-binding transcriptional ArsR family regulator
MGYSWGMIQLASGSPDLDATFAALADPTRRAILTRLSRGDASVLELAEPFDMSLPAISKHLKVLERAGLISRGRDAQKRPCHLEPAPLVDVSAWASRIKEEWEQRFDRLDAYLQTLQPAKNDGKAAKKNARKRPSKK